MTAGLTCAALALVIQHLLEAPGTATAAAKPNCAAIYSHSIDSPYRPQFIDNLYRLLGSHCSW